MKFLVLFIGVSFPICALLGVVVVEENVHVIPAPVVEEVIVEHPHHHNHHDVEVEIR